MNKKYVYIFVRKDLPKEQLVVQSSHLAWELSKKQNLDYHPSMVVVGISNEQKLCMEYDKLKDLGLDLATFYEPLFDNTLTAIGLIADHDQRIHMKRYQLLKIKEN